MNPKKIKLIKFFKELTMNDKDAQKVWDCIKAYRQSDKIRLVREFSKTYTFAAEAEKKIVEALNGYPGRGRNHGHASGRRGDSENPGSKIQLNNAIAFLNDYIEKKLNK